MRASSFDWTEWIDVKQAGNILTEDGKHGKSGSFIIARYLLVRMNQARCMRKNRCIERARRSWPCFDHKFAIFQLGTSGKLVINQVRRALWSRESARNIHFSGIPSCRRLICLSGLLSKDHHQSRLIVGNPLITSGPIIKHELIETVNSQSPNSKIFKINCPSFLLLQALENNKEQLKM